ncbi:hypothetical protein SBA4_6330008 [Candidatus Sulfopaludibacter sp. SbA4]|nr:hypothetical protein SBA4_6330008 [Candidatus Sulfopaludibacter sp. SbA4]
MRVAGKIGFLVVDTMGRHPENGPAFQRQRARYRKEILNCQRHLVGPVRMEPVVAHADAEAGAHPVEEQRDSQCVPTEHEQCRDGSEVEKAERDGIGPVALVRVGYVDRVLSHGASGALDLHFQVNRDLTIAS